MDVNRAQGISPTANNNSKGGRDYPSKEKTEEGGPEDVDDVLVDAFEIDGLMVEITPSAQRVLDNLAAEIEPLRRQLVMAKEREQNLREGLALHAFLPIPGRREFLRELNHVLNHLNDLSMMPCVALVHIANADEVRRARGRDALDRLLVHASNIMSNALQPTDVLGNLGGSDFALILLGADLNMARPRMAEILGKLRAVPLHDSGGSITIDANVGITVLSPGSSAEASINAADQDMIKQ
ncbi:MAG: GGDEF domain-containing protein [Rhodospirillales bacterium]